MFNLYNACRLGYNLVDAVLPGVSYVDVLCVPCASHNVGLGHALGFNELSYFAGSLCSVHNGHAVVHQNETVGHPILGCLFDFV